MSEQTAFRSVVVANRTGLHARPASLLVKAANGFQSEIRVRKNQQVVNAKSMMEVLTLAAEQGAELFLEATGCDAADAVAALADLLARDFAGEGEPDAEQPTA